MNLDGGIHEIPLPPTAAGRLWLCGKHAIGPDPEGLMDEVGADVVVATLTRAADGWTLTTGQGAVVPVDDAVEIWAMVEALVRVEI